MSRTNPRVAILLAAAPWLALLPLLSCTEKGGPETPLFEVGAVEGYALVAGRGESLEIVARLSTGSHYYGDDDAIIAETWSDSTGWYRLELPVGRYTLDTRSVAGEISADSRPDTVQVGPYVQRHDLRRGLARVRVRVPPAWDNLHCQLRLFDTAGQSSYDSDLVGDGWAEFAIHALDPGSYLMKFDSPFDEEFYLPGSTAASEADTLVVGLAEAAAYEIDFTETCATISGRVTGSWQLAPLLSVGVYAFAADSQPVSRDYCDLDGSFEVVLLVPREVRLMFLCAGADRWHGGATFAAATPFALQAGDRVTGIDVVEGGLEIWLDGPGDLVQRQADIEVCDEAGNVLSTSWSSGNPILIGNLLPGRVLLRLNGVCDRQTWAGQWFDGAATPAAATPIEVAAGERRRLDVVLTPGGGIAGVLREADGAIPGSLSMMICDDRGEPLCEEWSYFYDGAFSFSGLADGAYYLKALLIGGAPWWYPGTEDLGSATPIHIVDHGAVTGLSWLLPPDKGGCRP